MLSFISKLFAPPKRPLSLKEAIAQTRISTDPKHLKTFQAATVVKKDHNFIDVTSKEIPKRLGLTHNPKVRTIESTATFNQRAAAVNAQLKKGLKKIKKDAKVVPIGQMPQSTEIAV